MVFVLATNNPNKAREIGALFSCTGIDVLSLADLGLTFTPGEDGNTFVDNAVQKATETAAFLRGRADSADKAYAVLADDSGLIIDALGGLPGVDSALYMGADTPYEVRNAFILKQMQNVPDEGRAARFVCVAACVLPDGEVLTATGTLEGTVARECAGVNGFGYDPLFFLPERGLTLAQLSEGEKNEISHRGKAMREMARKLEGYA